jgi:hypothetical protein
MLLIGFSRGGTHLFWCFLASHIELVSRQIEVNELGSKRKLGLSRKLLLELASLGGSNSYSLNLARPNIVDKAVCSWPRDPIFKYLRRHDPMKYVNSMGFQNSYRVFLVKSPHDQIASWMRRGCSLEVAIESYLYHLKNWDRDIKNRGNAEVVSYEQFCNDAVGVTANVWKNAGLDPLAGAAEIRWAPKAHAANKALPSSQFAERSWVSTDKYELAASLRGDSGEVDLQLPNTIVDAYAAFIER